MSIKSEFGEFIRSKRIVREGSVQWLEQKRGRGLGVCQLEKSQSNWRVLENNSSCLEVCLLFCVSASCDVCRSLLGFPRDPVSEPRKRHYWFSFQCLHRVGEWMGVFLMLISGTYRNSGIERWTAQDDRHNSMISPISLFFSTQCFNWLNVFERCEKSTFEKCQCFPSYTCFPLMFLDIIRPCWEQLWLLVLQISNCSELLSLFCSEWGLAVS